MDRKQLEWLLVQCQFNNSLGTSVLDSMAYYLLNEALERRTDLCDPVHYLELNMHTETPPDGYKFGLVMSPAAALASWTVRDNFVDAVLLALESGLDSLIRSNSGTIVAGTVRAHITLDWTAVNLYVSFTTATKEQTHGDGTDKSGAADTGAADTGAGACPGDIEHKGDDPVPG